MPRFVLRYLGQGSKPEAVMERLRALPDTVIVDETARMLLVEADDKALRPILDNPTEWLIVPEQQIPLPDARPKPKRRR